MPENTTQKDTKWLITCGLLVLCCFLLFAILLTLHKNNQNGRYILDSRSNDSGFYILDTKTGHVWYRVVDIWWDFGTPEKPIFEQRKLTEKQWDIFDEAAAKYKESPK